MVIKYFDQLENNKLKQQIDKYCVLKPNQSLYKAAKSVSVKEVNPFSATTLTKKKKIFKER